MPHVPFDDFVCSSTPLNQPWSLARYRNLKHTNARAVAFGL